jgi:hypothetical protein
LERVRAMMGKLVEMVNTGNRDKKMWTKNWAHESDPSG